MFDRVKKNLRNSAYMRAWRKKHPILKRRRDLAFYRQNPERHAYQRHVSEMRYVIRILGGFDPLRRTSLGDLYNILVRLIRVNPSRAQKKFPHGVPDAVKQKVEFKIGFDRLHQSQFVWNVLNGHECKVRWFPSYDDLEVFLRGRKSKGKLFRSYKDFILWKYGK